MGAVSYQMLFLHLLIWSCDFCLCCCWCDVLCLLNISCFIFSLPSFLQVIKNNPTGQYFVTYFETQIVFQRCCTIWYSNHQYVRVSIYPHPVQHFFPCFFCYNLSSECEVISHCGFDLNLPTVRVFLLTYTSRKFMVLCLMFKSLIHF